MTKRTYKKNMILIKDTSNALIDEALIILKDDGEYDECDIIAEADRIIGQSAEMRRLRRKKSDFALTEFILGIAVSAAVSVLLLAIF